VTAAAAPLGPLSVGAGIIDGQNQQTRKRCKKNRRSYYLGQGGYAIIGVK